MISMDMTISRMSEYDLIADTKGYIIDVVFCTGLWHLIFDFLSWRRCSGKDPRVIYFGVQEMQNDPDKDLWGMIICREE
jgi:hypothetical protein